MGIFNITVRTRDGDDSIRTLRAALKVLLRRFGLRAISVEDVKEVTPQKKRKKGSA